MREHLRVRLALEAVAAGDELIAQGGVVLDDAVVHHRDLPGLRKVRVAVLVRGLAVRGPAGVADAGGAGELRLRKLFPQALKLPPRLDHAQIPLLQHRHAR